MDRVDPDGTQPISARERDLVAEIRQMTGRDAGPTATPTPAPEPPPCPEPPRAPR